ncbi:unnamed protein product [Mytilus edulis]|uniref:Reverse transcriptase domain-containing protein n=1 Tax=Mytilus edulis TaxID=6550 RepID=A0A8S3QLY2_MYTED|nr:unnamed protein product [Mytilus edulis]
MDLILIKEEGVKEWWSLLYCGMKCVKPKKCGLNVKIKRNKRELRHIFVNKRRIFDKAVQSSNGKYWYSLQEDLIKSCDNPNEFWRKIGKIGVGSERRSFIPMEVKLSDESVSCDKKCSKGIITPIPKRTTADPRDPMACRGITLAPVSYKLYCGVLNSRLTVKLDELNFLHDEQNGFRKGRNTIDHISTLTTVIETRKLHKLSTYVAFIDFKKAYDWINRDLLFGKLENLGISSKMLNAIFSLYRNVYSCVKVNGNFTDWFEVKCGLKQGCILSPILFNIFINDLVDEVKKLDIGVKIDDEKICVLLYADDLVFLTENEKDLQKNVPYASLTKEERDFLEHAELDVDENESEEELPEVIIDVRHSSLTEALDGNQIASTHHNEEELTLHEAMNILDDGVNEENGNLPQDCTHEDDFVVPEPSFSQTAILQENVSPYYKQMYQRKFYNEQNKENVPVHQQNVNQKQLPVFNTGLTDFYRQIHRETLSAFPLEQFSDELKVGLSEKNKDKKSSKDSSRSIFLQPKHSICDK